MLDILAKKQKGDFILMNKSILILAHPSNRIFKELKSLETDFCDMDSHDFNQFKDKNYDYIVDFSLHCYNELTEESVNHLHKLHSIFKAPIICDFSAEWGEYYYDNLPFIHGALSTGFFSPKNCYEYCTKNSDAEKVLMDLFTQLQCDSLKVSTPGIGFNFPRVLVQIINEAYFAQDEKVASSEDMDLAMKFGVNHPLGPFEWSKKQSLSLTVKLLKKLLNVTGDGRYNIAPGLQKKSYEGHHE
jgi:3-hydroxybutyryl-CoA dehydrogenase